MRYRKKNEVECPNCDGTGDVLDITRCGMSTRIDPPIILCPLCGGSGSVPEDVAEGHEDGRDYAAEAREEAALRRWEERREEGR